ncbi:sensor histidine kinase [Pedobacter paludis]|uniref:Histidine kinase n=1 Tax=Pedobacter paludis TaxID=2203212 RepID=A0A317F7W9_9SPHI|nr:hypothetical protein [Pedobacter paludis]PWS33638.1 hypothetical protein DF947_03215 [Pedobacter paludis]
MEIPKLQPRALEPIIETEEDLRKAIFLDSEIEKGNLASFLYDDIAQLLFQLKSQSDHNLSSELQLEISHALDRVRNASFELRPKIYETFGLFAALKELFSTRFKFISHEAFSNFIKLPDNLSEEMELAIFRLTQQTLDCIDIDLLRGLSMSVGRLDNEVISLTYGFAFDPSGPLVPRTDFAEKLRSIVYLLSGRMVFREYSQNQLEVVVYFNEQ